MVRLPLPLAVLARRMKDGSLRAGDINAFLDVAPRRAAAVPLATTTAACGSPSPADDGVDGTLDFKTKEGAGSAPPGFHPWFDVPGRRSAGTPIACGHWSTLGLVDRPDLLALDTGCVWGGCLTAVRIDGGRREVTQVKCARAQEPGTV